MSRAKLAPGEKALFWMVSSLEDLLTFPDAVKDVIGTALSVAQFGGKDPKSKPWKGSGSGVLEIVEDHRGNADRAIYTVKFANAVYVLHSFQKKSPSGIRTPTKDIDLVDQRLKLAQKDYRARYEIEKK
jgi:phage-related protein